MSKILHFLLPSSPELQKQIYARQQALIRLRERLNAGAIEHEIRLGVRELVAADKNVIDLELALIQDHLPKDRPMPTPLTRRIMWLGDEVCFGHLEMNPVLFLQVLQAADPRYRTLVEEIDGLERPSAEGNARAGTGRLESTRREAQERRVAFLRRVLLRLNADPETDPIVAKCNK